MDHVWTWVSSLYNKPINQILATVSCLAKNLLSAYLCKGAEEEGRAEERRLSFISKIYTSILAVVSGSVQQSSEYLTYSSSLTRASADRHGASMPGLVKLTSSRTVQATTYLEETLIDDGFGKATHP
ncbi:hypothetical protein KCU92_g253, partial [Aureobasidium melanogenum]